MHLSSRLALLAYKTLTTLVAPLGASFLAYKKRNDPPYGKRIFELLGCYKDRLESCVWFHGASVGEINAIKPLIVEFQKQHPFENIVLTTMTTTGLNAAKYLKGVNVEFSPLDSPLAVSGFLNSFNPKALIIIDTELWPNMLGLAKKHGCMISIVNARMQEKNCISYLKHKTLVEDLISSNLSKVMCITEADKERFIKIGVPKQNVMVTGNIKYDLKPRENMFNDAMVLKTQLLGDCVFGAISTHDGEETTIIDSYVKAKETIKDLKLVLVPRHQTAGTLSCEYLDKLGISYVKKSSLKSISDFTGDILIGDTIGEIETYFGLCDLVLMGGSFVNIGGHNPLEPAFFSLPILTGPDYHNFTEQFDKLIECGGAYLAEDSAKLSKYIVKLLSDKELLKKTGIKALDIQQQGRGALNKTLEQLDKLLY